MLKTIKQQNQELMERLKSSARKRKEERLARPPQPQIMVRDPRTGVVMSKDDYQSKYQQQ